MTKNRKKKNYEDFYIEFRRKIEKWAEGKKIKNRRILEFILLAPDLFYLLYRLWKDPDVDGESKLLIAFVLFYFVSPMDLIPEAILGPFGFLDDVAIASYALKRIMDRAGNEKIVQYWPGEDDIVVKVNKIVGEIDNYLGSGLWRKLVDMVDKKYGGKKRGRKKKTEKIEKEK